MGRYDNCSREELIRRIEEFESGRFPTDTPVSAPDIPSKGRYGAKYARKILSSLPDMLTVITRAGVIADLVSSDETNHVGVPSEQIIGQSLRHILSPRAYRSVKNNLEQVFVTGRGSVAHHDITLDGRTHNYENRIFPLDEDHALCVCRDITDTEAARHELEMVKYALNNVKEEIYACRLNGSMVYANERFRVRHGLENDITRRKVYEFRALAGSDRQWEELLAKIRDDGGVHKYTIRCKDHKDRVVARDIVAYIIYDHFRREEMVWFFAQDVTMRIENETKIREMNIVMESILNNIPVYLFVKDPGNEFRHLYWNKAFADFSHIPASRALGHTDEEIFPNPLDAEKFRRDDLQLLRTGERLFFEEQYVTMKGEIRDVHTSKALVPVENRLPLIIGVAWDVTQQKRTERELVAARNKAEESDRLKSAFLANMSHEIRTPLNAIVGFAKLVGIAETEEEKKQYVEIIDANSELLLQLINDILDISKIEAGTLEFRYRTVSLRELFRAQYEVHKDKTKPGVALRLDDRYGEAEVVCDQNRLAQVVTNLLNNASKFTREGEIRFGYYIEADRICGFVQDTGVGIPIQKQHDIFDRFIKLNDFAAGTGLGLAISKMIVEKMGGEIGVESEEGVGTRFWFSLPCVCGPGTQEE